MIEPTKINDADWEQIRHLIPGPDPKLTTTARVIPVADTLLDGNELRYVTECVQSNWLSSIGPFVGRFEQAFARRAGCEFGIACANGTVALHLALATLGIGPGDEVIIPTFTMIATANAVSYTGATPVLIDAEAETWNLDVTQLAARITPRTKAIIVVHTYGHPVEMDAVLAIARQHNLPVLEDAAEAHGAEYRGQLVGSLGDAATFSFYANKIITTGEGGMVTTNDARLAATARQLRDHAFSTARHFWHEYRGFNYRMSNLQAAVGLAQTERLPQLIAKRRQTARRYAELLHDVPGLRLPRERPEVQSVFWMYGLLVEEAFGCSRDELRQWLAAHGVETRTFFIPIHLQPIYFAAQREERYPVAEALCQRGLYLPSGPTLSETDIQLIAQLVKSARRQL